MRSILVAALALGWAGAASAAPLDGTWVTASGEKAEIYGCGEALCIRITTGVHKGRVISENLKPDGGGAYAGSLLNPEDGRLYSGRATPAGDSELRLRGCALKIFCKTQTWTRAN